jgi:hypothetical protein
MTTNWRIPINDRHKLNNSNLEVLECDGTYILKRDIVLNFITIKYARWQPFSKNRNDLFEAIEDALIRL